MNNSLLKLLRIIFVLCSAAPLLLVNACSETVKPVKDNTLVQLMLTRQYYDGGYTIVKPETYHPFFELLDRTEMIEQIRDGLKAYFNKLGYKIDSLVDSLFEQNAKQYRLSLASAPAKGYLIDYDDRFEYYFDHNNPEWQHGWDRLREDYPKTHGITVVGLPAYDPETGLVLAYIGWAFASAGGEGHIILYKYQNGQLIELTSILIWEA